MVALSRYWLPPVVRVDGIGVIGHIPTNAPTSDREMECEVALRNAYNDKTIHHGSRRTVHLTGECITFEVYRYDRK